MFSKEKLVYLHVFFLIYLGAKELGIVVNESVCKFSCSLVFRLVLLSSE